MSEQKIREALESVREALQMANDSPNGGISDTIWMPHTPQTLFDFIDEALAQQPAAVVELTNREITAVLGKSAGLTATKIIRAVIAAHIAKQGGGV